MGFWGKELNDSRSCSSHSSTNATSKNIRKKRIKRAHILATCAAKEIKQFEEYTMLNFYSSFIMPLNKVFNCIFLMNRHN